MPKISSRRKLLGFPKSYAFVIGIDQYPHINGNLVSAVNDATKLASVLEKEQRFTHVELLKNATKKDFEDLFKRLTNPQLQPIITEKDSLLFYYAGHGKAGEFNEGPAGFLLPSDTKPALAALENESLIPMELLFNTLKQLNCHHTLLILDCCFAGKFRHVGNRTRDTVLTHFLPMYVERFQRYKRKKAWQVLVSSGATETAADWMGSRDNEQLKHSPFAQALFKALEGEAEIKPAGKNLGDGVLTAHELYLYLWDKIEKETKNNPTVDSQHPELFPMGNHDGGEFIFFHPKHALNFAERKERNPYPGLRPYHTHEDDIYFGRRKHIEQALEKLKNSHILVISAPTGFGKTSFVQAGLFPHFRDTQNATFHVFTPGARPASEWQAFNFQINEQNQQILLIDQFEQLFTACDDKQQLETFEEELSKLLEKLVHHPRMRQQKLKVIITVRSDFEWQLKASETAKVFWTKADLQKVFYRLPPLTLSELKQAVIQPALVEAFDFESEDLINQIIEEANYAPGALPLLSFGMRTFVQQTNKDRREFKWKVYDELGGISGALSKKADEVYSNLPFLHHDIMRRILLRMVMLKDGAYVRRRVPIRNKGEASGLNELDFPNDFEDNMVHTVLERLEKEGLIVRDKDRTNQTYVEPAHDALINFWPKCLTWIQEFGEDRMILQRQLWSAVKATLRSEEHAFYWKTDPRLQILADIINQGLPEAKWFNEAELNFIKESQLMRDKHMKQLEEAFKNTLLKDKEDL